MRYASNSQKNLVNEFGNIPRRGPIPKFSDLEVVALALTAEAESIDSEKWLFEYKLQEYKDDIPNLISRRQFNDRRKKTSGLCEEIRKRIAMKMDGGEEQFFVDSKPIEVCRVARGKHCKWGVQGNYLSQTVLSLFNHLSTFDKSLRVSCP